MVKIDQMSVQPQQMINDMGELMTLGRNGKFYKGPPRGLKPGQKHSGSFMPVHDPRRVQHMKFGGRTIAELAREVCPQAIELLTKAMQAEEVPWPARIQAANSLLDRGIGRAVTVIDMQVVHKTDPTQMSDEELLKVIEGSAVDITVQEEYDGDSLQCADLAQGEQELDGGASD